MSSDFLRKQKQEKQELEQKKVIEKKAWFKDSAHQDILDQQSFLNKKQRWNRMY